MNSAARAVRPDQRRQHSGIFLGPRLAHGQHLLGGAREDVGDEVQDMTDAEIDGDRIPRRADAEGIDMAVGKAFDHIGRRQHNEAHILIRIHSAGGHPEAQLVVVRRERESHAEHQRIGTSFLARRDHPQQRLRGRQRVQRITIHVGHDRRMKRRRNGDRVAVQSEIERRHDRDFYVAEAEARSDCDRRQQMRGVEQSEIQLVAYIRPRDFTNQRNVQPLFTRKPLADGHQQGGCIDKRNKPDPQRRQRAALRVVRHFSISDAVMIDCAISAIFFFSRIAVERIST